MYNPVEGLREIEKTDIEPGDEVIFVFEGSQILGATYYVHIVLPRLDGATERERQKQQNEIAFLLDRNRKFYLVKKGN